MEGPHERIGAEIRLPPEKHATLGIKGGYPRWFS